MKKETESTLPDDRWEALARWVAGESTPEEAAEVEAWLAAEPGRRERLEGLNAALGRLAPAVADIDAATALEQIHARIDASDVVPLTRARERTTPGRRMTLLRAAAVIALLLAGGLVWRRALVDDPIAPAVAAASWSTEAGQTESITLPDGSTVLLGPLSRIELGPGFGDASREVTLNGEALFDVRDADRPPFAVRAGSGVIVDLGTTFSVRSVESDEVRVVVTSGSVRLHAAARAGDPGVVLRAGDRGVLRGDGVPVAESAAATGDDVAWTEGRLVFEDTPLDRVRTELRRWYDIELRIDDALLSRTLTATFENESLDEVLNVLELVLGATVERRGDTAFVTGSSTR